MKPRVVSINVGRPRTLTWDGRGVTTSIWKDPVEGPVAARGVNLVGDDQADRQSHGGPDKAVYAYGMDDYRFWHREFGVEIRPGLFGDNLTIDGLDVSHATIGERWEIGTAVFEVCQPRIPCYKLGIRMHDVAFPRRFIAAGRPGAYLRIFREGVLAAGDEVRVVHRPDHDVTSAFVAHAYNTDRRLAPRLLEIPRLSARMRDWAERMVREGPRLMSSEPDVEPALE